MPHIKRIVVKYLWRIAAIMVLTILAITVGLQILNEQRQARETAAARFYQIEQVLEENQEELEELTEEYRQTCLRTAEAIAYIIEQNPSALDSVAELREIAEFLEVDEIHIFDNTGRIFTGTHPEYYGYTFDSGEQMAFFQPMLTDRSLKLCQDITPNTAESKLMQYSAIWSEHEDIIVQVGMEPVNVMKITEKNELSYIFSLLRANVGVDFYAINAESGEIMGSTTSSDVGKHLTEIGFNLNTVSMRRHGFHETVNGVDCYCVFTEVGTNLIGRVVSVDVLYEEIPAKALELTGSLILIAIILVVAMAWCMNRFVIAGIYDVNEKLRTITGGNLDEKVDVRSSREFSELSDYINDMINSLLSSTEKLSYVLNNP